MNSDLISETNTSTNTTTSTSTWSTAESVPFTAYKESEADKFPVGSGYNFCDSKGGVKSVVLRSHHIGELEKVNLKMVEGLRMEKLSDYAGGVEVFQVGLESFMLKVARSRHTPNQEHLLQLFSRERSFKGRFRVDLKNLPKQYSHNDQKLFKAFYEAYGQGLLLNSYHGGEVCFRLLEPQEVVTDQPNFTSSQVFEALRNMSHGGTLNLKDLDRRYLVSFKGGPEHLRKLEHLDKWTNSLKTNPQQIVLDYREDVVFYHELVMQLKWLKESSKRAKALEEAFAAIYLKPEVHSTTEVVAQASAMPVVSSGSSTSSWLGMWKLLQSAISSNGPKKVRVYKPFDF